MEPWYPIRAHKVVAVSHFPSDTVNPLSWLQAWQQALAPQAGAAQAFPSMMPADLGLTHPAGSLLSPEKVLEIQQRFSQQWTSLCAEASSGKLQPITDPRFAGPAWQQSPAHAFMAHAYLLSARTLLQMAETVEAPDVARERVRFATLQWIDAMAPSNFLAFNPDAQKTFIESGGESLQQGLSNLVQDFRKGRVSNTNEDSFVLGESLAVTQGAVVFENALFQLIQYKPLTTQVHGTPLLMVPPCINKFYILDLQPANSFVRFALEQGFTVFMMSWRNPRTTDTDGIEQASWDDYIEHGVIKALSVTQEITGRKTVHTLGFCVGGTLLATALALLKTRGQSPAASVTLLTTLLDFDDTGLLKIFVDEAQTRLREAQFAQGGLLPARELGTTFSFLRPNDLVWNSVVSHYLKGEKPSSFDLLFWNADGTNLPGIFYAWYLRNTYLENKLKVPGATTVCGAPIDLRSVDVPSYIYGSKEDHIVPWKSAYASRAVLGGASRFVLGAAGHIAGVINPAAKNRRNFWVYDTERGETPDADAWFSGATSVPGSWWSDWADWLAAQSDSQVKAKTSLGSKNHPVIEAAPGRYVRIKAI